MVYGMIKILLVGFGVLLTAVAVNFLAKWLGSETWYDFIESIQKNGILKSLKKIGLNLLFLNTDLNIYFYSQKTFKRLIITEKAV